MMLEMKHILRMLLVCAGLALVAKPTQAQTVYEIRIDSVIAFPDTIVNGDSATFYMSISLQNTPLLYQGNIYLELEYGDSLHQVDNVLTSNAFLSPNFPTSIQAVHRFSTDDDLSIGDNVVVVWPRIGDGTDPPQVVVNPYETVVTLIEPNGIKEHSQRKVKPLFHPNPANNTIRFVQDETTGIKLFTVTDAMGRQVLRSNPTAQLDVSELINGIYTLAIYFEDGTVRSNRLVISH